MVRRGKLSHLLAVDRTVQPMGKRQSQLDHGQKDSWYDQKRIPFEPPHDLFQALILEGIKGGETHQGIIKILFGAVEAQQGVVPKR